MLLKVNFTLSDDIRLLTHFQDPVQRNTTPKPQTQQAAVILETAAILSPQKREQYSLYVFKFQAVILRESENKNLKILSQMICLV